MNIMQLFYFYSNAVKVQLKENITKASLYNFTVWLHWPNQRAFTHGTGVINFIISVDPKL